MKAMILAAGRGKRMGILTANTPKPLVKLGAKSLIVRLIESLARAGITQIVINVHYHYEQIVSMLGGGKSLGVELSYSVESELLDTGGGIVAALPMLGPDPFLVLSADLHCDMNWQQLVIPDGRLAHLVMVDNPSFHTTGDFVLQGSDLLLEGEPKLTYASIGVYKPEFFANAPDGAFPLSNLLRQHIKAGKVSAEHYHGLWFNVGTPTELALAAATV